MPLNVTHLVDDVRQFFHKHKAVEAPAPLDLQHAAHAVEGLPAEKRAEGKRLLGLEAGTLFQRREFDDLKDSVARDWGELEVVLPFLAEFPKTNYAYDVSPGLRRGDRPDSKMLKALADQGFTASLNLCKEIPHGDRHIIKEAELGRQLSSFHVGIVDGTPPSYGQMIDILQLLAALEADGEESERLLAALEADKKQLENARKARTMKGAQRVYVHCEAGKGRTGVVVACYRMAVMGWGMDQALTEAKNFGCSTPDQLQFIQDFGNDLRDGRVDGYPRKPFRSVAPTEKELAATLEAFARPPSNGGSP